MKKHYIIDSQIEVEMLNEYIKQLKYRFGEVEIVEDNGGRKILKIKFEAKVIVVPTEENWKSIK